MRFLVLALALWLVAPGARAELSPAERRELAAALRAVSAQPGSDGRVTAGPLLLDPKRERADFQAFFAAFFDTDPLTPALLRYLTLPTLEAPSARTRAALQEALAAVLVDEIDTTFRTHLPDHLGPALERRPATFQHLAASLQLLGRIAYQGDQLSQASRRAHYGRLKRLIAAHPGVLRKRNSVDTRAQPKLAAVRAHLYKNLRDLAAPFDPAAFNADAGFEDRYAELVTRHGVLVLDNNGFDARQLQAIGDVLDLIPSRLHDTTHISEHGLLGNRRADGQPELRFEGSPGVNISSIRVGQALQNQFPSDIEPIDVSGFCAVLQHELNHVVESATIRKDPALSTRHRELIERAGSNPQQYLRSMLPGGLFVAQPQEFFASISNSYFADSLQTLRVAIERLDRGWQEPVNQFLFFAEVYSMGGSSTLFFEQDGDCNYTAHRVPVGRDTRGRIDRIRWLGVDLAFELDEAGYVVRPLRPGHASSARGPER